MRRIGGAAIAAVLILGLSACTPAEPKPTETSTPVSSATPTTAPGPTTPVSSYGLGCKDLVPADIVSSALAPSVVLEAPFTDDVNATPINTAPVALGGLQCSWGNGEPRSRLQGGSPLGTERWAQVLVLPQASARWQPFFEGWTSGEPGPWENSTPLSCFTGDGRVLDVCSMQFLVGDSWVEVLIDGPADNVAESDEAALTAVMPFVESIRTALEPTASAPRFDWGDTTAGPAVLPTECEGFVPEATMSDLLGQQLVYTSAPKKGGSASRGAADDLGVPDCIFGLPDSDSARGLLTALPRGQWAYEQLVETRMKDGADISFLALDGLGSRDAFLQCRTEIFSSCSVHLTVDGHWLRIDVSNESSADPVYGVSELGAQATAYAQAAAAGVLSGR